MATDGRQSDAAGPQRGPSENPGAARGSGGSLASATTRGFAWLLAQTVGTRILTFGTQLVLAALLAPEVFGVMALAQTAQAVVVMIHNIGMRDILVQRSHKLRLWLPHAFHLSLVIGVLAGLLMAMLGPAAAAAYDEPQLIGVVAVLAITPVFAALQQVCDSVLRSRMRFAAVAMIEIGVTVTTAVTAISLARLGFGVYALAIPVPVAAAVGYAVTARLARVGVPLRVRPRRWPFLLSSGGKLGLSRVFLLLAKQGDYVAMGLFLPTAAVGLYYFAFNLSLQTVRLLTRSLVGVLLPVLSEIKSDIRRATSAYIRATTVLSIVGMPAALLQALVAVPLLRTLFNERWWDAAELLQILSLAMAFQLVGQSTSSMLKSQRRYTTVLVLTAIQAVTLLSFVFPAAMLGDTTTVALAVLAYSVITAPLRMIVSVAPGGGTWIDVCRVVFVPALAGAAASAAGIAAAEASVGGAVTTWLGASVTSAVGLPVYAMLVRLMLPSASGEIASMAGRGLSRVRNRSRSRARPAGTGTA